MNIHKPHNALTILAITLAALIAATALGPAGIVQANGALAPAPLIASTPIYGNSLATGWQDWSWNATRNLSNSSPTQSGTASISVTITQAWGALYLHHTTGLSTASYTHLEFYIHGGTSSSQRLNVIANRNTSKLFLVSAVANTWTKVSVPLTSLGSPSTLTDLYWQDAAGKAQPKFYLDSIALVSTGGATPTATRVGPTATRPAPTATNTGPTATRPAPTATLVGPTATLPAPTPTRPAPTATAGTSRYFSLLPPGSKLPSEAECAAAVKSKAENKRMNPTYNATRGSQTFPGDYFGSSYDPRANTEIGVRVTGNFTGTTDEILQWAACKWGIDEDMVRAQAAIESWWQMTAKGDWTSDANSCAPGHGLGVDGRAGQCPDSWGILQVRYSIRRSLWPSMANSTAFNADVAYAEWRSCYEGYEWWLNTVERGSQYAAGDAYGCMGRWFSGRWHTAPADDYISRVKNYLNTRIWETASFQEP